MPKKCKRCGTVNDSDARYCKACQNPFSSKAGGGGKSMFCKKCNSQKPVKGRTTNFIEPVDPTKLNLEEWECAVLGCNHIIPIRKTGREKNDILGLS